VRGQGPHDPGRPLCRRGHRHPDPRSGIHGHGAFVFAAKDFRHCRSSSCRVTAGSDGSGDGGPHPRVTRSARTTKGAWRWQNASENDTAVTNPGKGKAGGFALEMVAGLYGRATAVARPQRFGAQEAPRAGGINAMTAMRRRSEDAPTREAVASGFDAFLSYSHACDGRLAPSLQHGLQTMAKPWYRRRALRIFRDQTRFRE
jgi:hypothetical protein